MKQYLECGKIVSTHGIGGEVKVQPWCDAPEFLLLFDHFYMRNGQATLEVEGARIHKNMALLKFRGVDTLDQAVTLRGNIVYIDREDAPPSDDGSFFVQDLIGLSVQDADTGQEWGTLCDVLTTGANDVYVLKGADGRQLLVPAIKDVILSTDLETGIMVIRPLEGLFDAD